MGRALPLIDDTDVSKRAVGAALIQEVRDDGFKEIKLIFHVGVHQDHEWCWRGPPVLAKNFRRCSKILDRLWMLADQKERTEEIDLGKLCCCEPKWEFDCYWTLLPVNGGPEFRRFLEHGRLGEAESLNLFLTLMTFLSDRTWKLAVISTYIKEHVKTAINHPEANGKIERWHKELGMICLLNLYSKARK